MHRFQEVFIRSSDEFERGRQHGEQTAEKIQNIKTGYMREFEKKGYTWRDAEEMALKYGSVLNKECPELLREAEWMAMGASCSIETILVLNARYELLKFAKGQDFADDQQHEYAKSQIYFDLLGETMSGHGVF